MNKLLIILSALLFGCSHLTQTFETAWTGRWFPESPKPAHNGIPMGMVENCDDGKTNLEVDYDGSAEFYTCFDQRAQYLPNKDIHPVMVVDPIPKAYSAPHYCMNESIYYKDKIPSFGGHRPVWPKYGEYKYVPSQRWLHSLEHGAVVMLYHPCANGQEVKFLKDLVKNCLFRHIITPSPNMTSERPLALLTWGHKLLMSKFDPRIALKFMRAHANHAPEHTTKDGMYELDLEEPAHQTSNAKDNHICERFFDVDKLLILK